MNGGRWLGFVSLVGWLSVLVSGCASDRSAKLFERDTITQVSSYNGLLAGLYDGLVSYGELRPYGDFGLGTFDRMNGEMVMLDGVLYQIDFSGRVNVMSPNETTPYVTMVNFHADQEIAIPSGMSYDQVSRLIESKLANPNAPYAVRIDGTFGHMKCRSVPVQSKPYPPLAEIAKHQAVFERDDAKGTVVGFRYPQYAGTFNVPGFHVHFVDDVRVFGGHVLDFRTGPDVVARIDCCTRLMAYIPDSEEARKTDLSLDRSAAMQNVNRNR